MSIWNVVDGSDVYLCVCVVHFASTFVFLEAVPLFALARDSLWLYRSILRTGFFWLSRVTLRPRTRSFLLFLLVGEGFLESKTLFVLRSGILAFTEDRRGLQGRGGVAMSEARIELAVFKPKARRATN